MKQIQPEEEHDNESNGVIEACAISIVTCPDCGSPGVALYDENNEMISVVELDPESLKAFAVSIEHYLRTRLQ